MAFDEGLARRIRSALQDSRGVAEKKMFGGLAFLLDGNMMCGVVGDRLMVRVGPRDYESVLSRPHVREMDFTGRPLRGFVFVEPAGIAADRDLEAWIDGASRFVRSLPRK